MTAYLKQTPFARWLITQYMVLHVKCGRRYTASVPSEEARTSPGSKRKVGKKRKIMEDGERERPEKSAGRSAGLSP